MEDVVVYEVPHIQIHVPKGEVFDHMHASDGRQVWSMSVVAGDIWQYFCFD